MLGDKAVGYENNTRTGLINIMGIFGVGKERDRTFVPLFNFGEAVDNSVFIAFNAPVYKLGDLAGGYFHFYTV